MDLESKVALVTGGASGIGRGIALTLAKNGYDVAITYFGSSEGAENVVREIREMGRRAEGYKADLGKYSEICRVFEEIKRDFKTLEVFVNNAGLTEKSAFLDTTEETFDKICNLDFKGAYFCTQKAATIMRDNGTHGSIIIISSNNAFAHFADVSVYGSVKAAVGKFAEHAAIELARYNIRVNTIAPGWTDTGAARLDDKESTFYKIPLRKWADVSEIADAVVYLSSDSARSITGITVVIDNGALLLSDKRERYGF